MATLLGFDVSHHQGTVDFAAARKAGQAFVFVKATEGVGYTDPTFAANRAKARTAGLVVGTYHFARAGDPVAEADYYCRQLGQPAIGELVVLDWEVAAANPVAWCKAWIDRVTAKLGVTPLIYMNRSTLNGFDWSPVIAANAGLWLAAYDGNQTIPAAGRWPTVAIKQFTSSGKVPGVPGAVDCNVFFGDLAALTRYGKQPAPAPTPAPAPVPEDFMANVSQADADAIVRMAWAFQPGDGKVGRPAGPRYNDIINAASGVAHLLSSQDPATLAAAIVAALPTGATGGLTVDDVKGAIRDVLAVVANPPA